MHVDLCREPSSEVVFGEFEDRWRILLMEIFFSRARWAEGYAVRAATRAVEQIPASRSGDAAADSVVVKF